MYYNTYNTSKNKMYDKNSISTRKNSKYAIIRFLY